MTPKKTFTIIFLILAICAVGAGCTYLINKIDHVVMDGRRYACLGIVIIGGICIVVSLIRSIMDTVQE